MSALQQIKDDIRKLNQADARKLLEWLESILEDQSELADEAKTGLDQSKREIAEGKFKIRRPR
jgi:hypothetical protein